ncbi:Cell division protein FtsQ [hydrothermal vent metagenome]|uniref:Cell division protein FtsQ n=1 Tax=hydrothermal vent metagenome TaxID=652676 RepID=A0A3B0XBD3_9ZZZZ
MVKKAGSRKGGHRATEKSSLRKNNTRKAKSRRTTDRDNDKKRSVFFIEKFISYSRQSLVLLRALAGSKIFITGLLLAVFAISYMKLREEIELKQWADSFFPVKSIQIEGEFKFLDKTRLQAQVLPVANGGFFTLDLSLIRSRLVEMSWVEDVSVRRQWPDRLLVRVIEKQPVVYWGEKRVMSSKGELFEPESRLKIELPRLLGPQGQHKLMLAELARMQAWLLESGFHIQQMQQDARRSWVLRMTTGLELRLGRKQLHERLHRFVSIYKTHLKNEKREIKHVDMRYTNGFAVAWKEA